VWGEVVDPGLKKIAGNLEIVIIITIMIIKINASYMMVTGTHSYDSMDLSGIRGG